MNEESAIVQLTAHRISLDGDVYRRHCEKLSGGNKRRLSLGLALIGNPEILILDEPSTGLDPETKRHIWSIIEEQTKIGSTILLTTHSMEEADTLCSHILLYTIIFFFFFFLFFFFFFVFS